MHESCNWKLYWLNYMDVNREPLGIKNAKPRDGNATNQISCRLLYCSAETRYYNIYCLLNQQFTENFKNELINND